MPNSTLQFYRDKVKKVMSSMSFSDMIKILITMTFSKGHIIWVYQCELLAS